MKVVIFEGIASSGKTTLERMLAENLPNVKTITEGTTLMPLIDNRDKRVALDYLMNVIGQIKTENKDSLIIDRFHLTHAFRTGASLKDFASIEDELKKLGDVLVVLLTMDPNAIKNRIEETMALRKDSWKKGAQGSIEEKVAYYTDQQSKLLSLLKDTTLQSITIDTTEKNWERYVSAIVHHGAHQPPRALTDVGLSMFVNTVKLRQLPLPVIDIPIEKLIWHFDMPVWEKEGTDDWNLTPWDVINNQKGSAIHRQRIQGADLNYPIIVTDYKSRLVILDGVHRLVKAYEAGQKMMKAKIIPGKYLSLREFQS